MSNKSTDTKKIAKKYFNKYFKSQYIKESDNEFKSLVRMLNKAKRKQDVADKNNQLRNFVTWFNENYMYKITDKAIEEYDRYNL